MKVTISAGVATILAGASLFAGSAAFAQDDVLVPPADSAGFGTTSASCDVTGDGVQDLVTGTYWFSDQKAAVYPGPVTGETEPLIFTVADHMGMGLLVSCSPDMNGDGIDDVIFVSQGGGVAVLFGGPNLEGGDLSSPGEKGVSLAGYQALKATSVGDLTGDGKGQLAVMSGKDVFIFDALPQSGELDLASATRITAGDGVSLLSAASAGDINGDGKADLVVGSASASLAGEHAGSAWVLTSVPLEPGGTIDLTQEYDGFRIDGFEEGHSLLGTNLLPAGDLNADGFDDLLIGAPSHDDELPGAIAVVLGAATNSHITTKSAAANGPSVIDAEGQPRGWIIRGATPGDHLGEGVPAVAYGAAAPQLLLGAMDGVVEGAPEMSGYLAAVDVRLLTEHGSAALDGNLFDLAKAHPEYVKIFGGTEEMARYGRSVAALAASGDKVRVAVGAPANFSQGTAPKVYLLDIPVKEADPETPAPPVTPPVPAEPSEPTEPDADSAKPEAPSDAAAEQTKPKAPVGNHKQAETKADPVQGHKLAETGSEAAGIAVLAGAAALLGASAMLARRRSA